MKITFNKAEVSTVLEKPDFIDYLSSVNNGKDFTYLTTGDPELLNLNDINNLTKEEINSSLSQIKSLTNVQDLQLLIYNEDYKETETMEFNLENIAELAARPQEDYNALSAEDLTTFENATNEAFLEADADEEVEAHFNAITSKIAEARTANTETDTKKTNKKGKTAKGDKTETEGDGEENGDETDEEDAPPKEVNEKDGIKPTSKLTGGTTKVRNSKSKAEKEAEAEAEKELIKQDVEFLNQDTNAITQSNCRDLVKISSSWVKNPSNTVMATAGAITTFEPHTVVAISVKDKSPATVAPQFVKNGVTPENADKKQLVKEFKLGTKFKAPGSMQGVMVYLPSEIEAEEIQVNIKSDAFRTKLKGIIERIEKMEDKTAIFKAFGFRPVVLPPVAIAAILTSAGNYTGKAYDTTGELVPGYSNLSLYGKTEKSKKDNLTIVRLKVGNGVKFVSASLFFNVPKTTFKSTTMTAEQVGLQTKKLLASLVKPVNTSQTKTQKIACLSPEAQANFSNFSDVNKRTLKTDFLRQKVKPIGATAKAAPTEDPKWAFLEEFTSATDSSKVYYREKKLGLSDEGYNTAKLELVAKKDHEVLQTIKTAISTSGNKGGKKSKSSSSVAADGIKFINSSANGLF